MINYSGVVRRSKPKTMDFIMKSFIMVFECSLFCGEGQSLTFTASHQSYIVDNTQISKTLRLLRRKNTWKKDWNRNSDSIQIQGEDFTYTRRQAAVPCPSLPGHALECSTAVQGVTLVTAKRDGTTSKVTLVADFKSELGYSWIITVGQLKAWTGKK